MAPVSTCGISQQQRGETARRSLRRCKRLLRLSDSKISNYRKRKCEDMRLRVLLNNTHSHLQDCAAELRRQRQEESVSQPALPSALDQDFPFGEDPQPDMAPQPNGSSPWPLDEGDGPSNSGDQGEEEANLWQVFSWDGLLWDPSSTSPELLATGFHQDLPLEEVLGLDFSGFEPISAPVPSDGQPGPEYMEQEMEDLQPAVFLDLDSGLTELESFVDLLISPQ